MRCSQWTRLLLSLAFTLYPISISFAGGGVDAKETRSGSAISSAPLTPHKAADPQVGTAPKSTATLQKYSLVYKFTPGQVLRSRVTQQTRVDTTISGSTQTAEMTSRSDKSWLVKRVEKAGDTVFETRWDAIEMRQKMTGRDEVKYNSATDKTAPAGYEQITGMIGKPLSLLTVDPRGKLLNRAPVNEESRKLLENSTYQATQQLLVPLPAEPVTLGQPWSSPTEIRVTFEKSPRVIQARQRYALDRVEKNIAVISHETILPPINEPEIRAQVIQQQGKGEIHFDLTAGRMIKHISAVEERVIGFHGPDSSLQFVSKYTEELLPAVDVAKQPAAAGKK